MQTKILFMVLFLSWLAWPGAAQQVVFQNTYSTTGPTNQGVGIFQQANGDFIVGGIRSVPVGGSQYIANIYLFRINSMGDTIWTKEIGTATERELAYGMLQLPNGDIILAGSINIPPNGLSDAFIVCTDNNGNTKWQKRYGGAMSEALTGVAYDGSNILVCGQTDSYGAGDLDIWLLKLNMSGDTLWTKTFGGVDQDYSWDIDVANNEYIITGQTYSFSAGMYNDAWIIKTDTAGNVIWQNTYGVANKVDYAWSLEPVEDNGTIESFVFVGQKNTEETPPGNAQGDLLFMKIDTAGNTIWEKTIPGTPWRREGFDIKPLANGGFIISGFKLDPSAQSQQLYMVLTDAQGQVVWDTAYGTLDSNYAANAVVATGDGGWAVTGSVFYPGQTIRYIFVTRFSPFNTAVASVQHEAHVWAYPNPVVDGELWIETDGAARIHKLKLISLDGRLIREYDAGGKRKMKLDVHQDAILQIFTDDGIEVQKIICD